MDYPWLRLWNVMLTSPKVQLLSDRDHRAWITLLVIANQGKPRGMLPSMDHIAFHLRCTVDEASAIMQRLADADLMDEIDGSWSPHDWSHWQPKSDKPSTQRSKECRERKRNVAATLLQRCETVVSNVAATEMQRCASDDDELDNSINLINQSSDTERKRCSNENATFMQRCSDAESPVIPNIPANIDTLAEEVEQVFPGSQFPGLVYKLAQIYLPTSVEYGFRQAIDMAWKGQTMTVPRITGLVKYAQDNKLIPSEGMRTSTKDPRPKPNGRPKTKTEMKHEAWDARLAELDAKLPPGWKAEDDDEGPPPEWFEKRGRRGDVSGKD